MNNIQLIKHFFRLDHFTPFYIIMFPNIIMMLIYGYNGTLVYSLFLVSISVLLILIGGCIWNDLIDLKYDQQCHRTKIRPLAAGLLPKVACITCIPFFAAFLFSTNLYYDSTHIFFYIGLILTLIYPFTKRFMKTPQIVLGMVNLTPLITFIQITDNAKPIYPAFSFYIMAILLIVMYDTLYAWQDREDDKKLGLGNLGLVISPKYMPLFIDLTFLSVWLCFAIHLSITSYLFWISFVCFISFGMSTKSKFIKHRL